MQQRSQNIFTSELFLSLLYFDLMHLLILSLPHSLYQPRFQLVQPSPRRLSKEGAWGADGAVGRREEVII